MNKNLGGLGRLMSGTKSDHDAPAAFEDLSAEEQAEILAEEKAQRIKYHHTSVRNGPISYRTISAGQQRRAAARAKKSAERKTNIRHRRNWLEKQGHIATLRGQLQVLGRLPNTARPTDAQIISAAQWVVANFGPRDEQGIIILEDETFDLAVDAAVDAYKTATKA